MTQLEPDQRVEIDISAARPRELVTTLCAALNHGLSRHDHWEAGCALYPWQASVQAFDLLPAAIINVVFDEWSDATERLDEIELSGYLDTGEGHRAWGFLAYRTGEPRIEDRPVLEALQLEEADGAYHLTATILRHLREGLA